MEYFSWHGYKYSPSSVQFFLNGKPLRLPEEIKNRCAYLAVCGKHKEVEDELKRFVRRERRTQITKKAIAFFEEGSDTKFYYTKELLYNPGDLQEELMCYKKWKKYIQDRNCILDVGYEITEGEINLFGKNRLNRKFSGVKIDLTRCTTVKILKNNLLGGG